MKGTRFQRLMALLLSLAMLVSGAAVVVSGAEANASGDSSSGVNTSLSEIKELLNAITYDEYVAQWFAEISPGKEAIEVDITDFTVGEGDDGFEVTTRDGQEVVFTPADGAITWKVEVPETARYALKIEYYPDQNRSASIERVLQLNGKVPFSEARYLTLPKHWANQYDTYFDAPEDMTLQAFADLAIEAGFKDAAVTTVTTVTGQTKEQVNIPFPSVWTETMTRFADEYGVRFFATDYMNNELRPSTKDDPRFMTFYLKDSSGFHQESFELVFEKGVNELTLKGRNEPMSIKSITLEPYESIVSYEQYLKDLTEKYGVDVNVAGKDVIRLEAEAPNAMSNTTIYPVEDRSCAINSPTDATRSVLNTVGGEKWATVGQWVEYSFTVGTSGMYDIVSRYKQDVLDGMFTCRAMYLYSDGLDASKAGYYQGAPFVETLRLAYDYDDEWQVTRLSDGRTDTNGDGKINDKDQRNEYRVYLEAGVTYTLRVEAALGKMGEIISQVQHSVDVINDAYLSIVQLTGTAPDTYRDYGFNRIMPDVMVDMVVQSRVLNDLADQLTELAGSKSSNVATLQTVADLLEKMGTDEDKVAGNLATLKENVGTLGTFLSDAKTQPLQLDFIQIQPAASELPAAMPGFFQTLWHEIVGFFQSFTRDYNNMGALEETDEEATEVWMASARDQFQVLRNLINYGYTGKTNIAVDLKLIAGGALLPSILAGSGPDVSPGMGAGDVINYAIRSAVLPIEDVVPLEGEKNFKEYAIEFKVDETFNTVYDEKGKIIIDNPDAAFNNAAMIQLGIADADGQMHYYGLPESQGFAMMFIRTDIMASLELDIPRTWEELMACIPTLQANNMEIGLPTDSTIFLYQMGGELFADDGMRINLDSDIALKAFDKMCNLFTMYSFPYSYSAANRFRSGEMPIILGDYVGTYNQMKIYATEIEGKWTFVPLPGERDEDGNINNVAISTVMSTVMVKGCDNEARAWSFMQWYTGADCQVDFANEMVAIMGNSAKQAVANRHALASLPWTTEEYREIQAQFNNLGAVPNYPGSYIIGRYTGFAFMDAYTANADPATEMLSHINAINKEITRKRKEFDLETLSDGETEYQSLLAKRMAQVMYLAEVIGEDAQYSDLMKQVVAAVKSEDEVDVSLAVTAVKDKIATIPNHAETYAADKKAVIGYDVNDRSLTKEEREDLRKCFAYEVYRNTSENVTRLYCTVEFLEDICTLLSK